jgi:tryptophan synthase alpha subunit
MDALRAAGKKALIPFIMAGDPNLETTAKAIKARRPVTLPHSLRVTLHGTR